MKDFKFLKSRSLPCNSTSSSTSDTTACTFSNHCGLSFGIIEERLPFAITLHRWKWQRQIHRITLFILHLHLNELTRRYRTVSRLNDVDTFQKSFVLRLDGELFQFQYLVGLQRTFAIYTIKNLELTKIEEQGTIFKKLNDYFVGSKEKTEINLNYPIYINGNSSLYNLSEGSTLISKNFEEISGYPNLSISEGKIYDGNNLERADAKEYIFVKTTDNIYINLYEIKVKTTANEYTIPVNSIIAFAENSIRYYSINNNVLVFI